MRAIETILTDFEKSHPMMRLLEGDVGAGRPPSRRRPRISSRLHCPLGESPERSKSHISAQPKCSQNNISQRLFLISKTIRFRLGLLPAANVGNSLRAFAMKNRQKFQNRHLKKWWRTAKSPLLSARMRSWKNHFRLNILRTRLLTNNIASAQCTDKNW